MNGTVQYGVAVTGTVVPPAFSEFGLFANFDADLDGILTVNTTASVRDCRHSGRFIAQFCLGDVRYGQDTSIPSRSPWFRLPWVSPCWIRSSEHEF